MNITVDQMIDLEIRLTRAGSPDGAQVVRNERMKLQCVLMRCTFAHQRYLRAREQAEKYNKNPQYALESANQRATKEANAIDLRSAINEASRIAEMWEAYA